ncbi:steroid receptor RNA activator 1-like [Saccostrea echinata]|uniref:steroid receptor RNA activator 1-like n=1 Tax=Saccostrea echinata TaxID=191078 RepID=UPI002A83996F|nr:steroid receptor RNA activator 1-like [Saccostrea echinata]
MAAPRPGNTERGWNDPPVFDYQSSSVLQSSHKRTNLNRRVAYPLSTNEDKAMSGSSGTTLNPTDGPPVLMPASLHGTTLNPSDGPPVLTPVVNPSPVQLLPPVPTTCAPSPVPLLIPGMVVAPPAVNTVVPEVTKDNLVGFNCLEEAVEGLKLQSPAELVDTITNSLHQSLEKVKSSLTERSFDDVKKKIQMFRESWDKLSHPVKCRMCSMADALKKNIYDAAWSIHQNLMVDYTTEVNVWMVGIKKIIHELKNLPEPSEAPAEGTESTEKSNSPVTQSDSTNSETGTSVDRAPENQGVTDSETKTKEVDKEPDIQTDNDTEEKPQSSTE